MVVHGPDHQATQNILMECCTPSLQDQHDVLCVVASLFLVQANLVLAVFRHVLVLWSRCCCHPISRQLYVIPSFVHSAGVVTPFFSVSDIMLGFTFQVDGFYLHSFEIWLACTVVFPGAGNIGFTLLGECCTSISRQYVLTILQSIASATGLFSPLSSRISPGFRSCKSYDYTGTYVRQAHMESAFSSSAAYPFICPWPCSPTFSPTTLHGERRRKKSNAPISSLRCLES